MTDDRMALIELLQKSGDGDFLRAVAEGVPQILMEANVEGLIGAGRHERSVERLNYRNGYRDRTLDTRLGPLSLRTPKLRQGSYFPPFLEPRKTTEKALVAVIQEALIGGVSTAGSTSWCKQWGSPVSRRARFRSCARTSTAGERLPRSSA
jgi:putative transposase